MTQSGLDREFASAPTLDTERLAPFTGIAAWTPSKLTIFGHEITIDMPTGNLIVSTSDVGYSYYNFTLGINRKYDVQEQQMQLSYLQNYANINPKPHWFGNWQFAYEADVDEVWQNSYPEIQVTSGIGANGLFEIDGPDFTRNLQDENHVEKMLRSYGVSKQTLENIGWNFNEHDFVLRSLRGSFQILSGIYESETLVDNINAKMWLFQPISGIAFHISSDYYYNIADTKYRDVGFPLTITKIVDALGHTIELKPHSSTITKPPFRKYVLADGSGREFHITMDKELTFLDGLNPGGSVRKYLVSKVQDKTKSNYNEFTYNYNDDNLLKEVTYPSSIIDNRFVRYHYDDTKHPGILTAIENFEGNKIEFSYIEDTTDNDERLNPRLKIKKIIDPQGITFEYEYNNQESEVIVTISQNDVIDKKVRYQYIRDIHNTKRRFITLVETKVNRGFIHNSSDSIIPRNHDNPQIIQNKTEYSNDGRFNVIKEIDPLNRTTRYEYNEFNQVVRSWDFDNHKTEHIYDIPKNPSPANPRNYDLISTKQENIIRETLYAPFAETFVELTKEYEYKKHNKDTSNFSTDYNVHSTHRIRTETNARNKTWTFTYDDSSNHTPLTPTKIQSPLGHIIKRTYNNRGEIVTQEDLEKHTHHYLYDKQGNLVEYTNPNKQKIKITYYHEGIGVHIVKDELSQTTEFLRDAGGKINKITDPINDSIDYQYYPNGRLHKVTSHRPTVKNESTGKDLLIKEYLNLETEFQYSPLGELTSLKNPKGLDLRYDHDEVGRVYQWYHNVPNSKYTRFVFDAASQLKVIVDRKENTIKYSYYNSGFVKSIQHPRWHDGTKYVPGKTIEYKKYDYLGQPLTIKDSEQNSSQEYQFVYDETGNLVLRLDPDGFGLIFDHDDDNRLWHVKEINGGQYELTLILDALGRPTSLQDSDVLDGSLSWNYKYEKQLDSTTKKVMNLYEHNLPSIGLSSHYDYDKKNRLKSTKHFWNDSSEPPILSQNFNYREDDLLETITDNNNDEESNSFLYDGLKQIVYEKKDDIITEYDEVGNRLYRKKIDASTITQNKHNQLNRLKESFPSTYEYDENGNLATSKLTPLQEISTKFYFDGINRLRLIKTNQHTINYLYDMSGNLIKRTVTNNETGDVEDTVFHYLITKPITVERNDVSLMLLTWDTNGRLLRMRRNEPISTGDHSNSIFPLYDGLNNIVRFMDDSKKEQIKIDYDIWGEIEKLHDPQNLFDFWGYKGGIFDRHSRNLLFGVRWYSPKTGRWISEDPLVQKKIFESSTSMTENYSDLSNLYSYSANNPVNSSDPSGFENDGGTNNAKDAAFKFGIVAAEQGLERGGHSLGNYASKIAQGSKYGIYGDAYKYFSASQFMGVAAPALAMASGFYNVSHFPSDFSKNEYFFVGGVSAIQVGAGGYALGGLLTGGEIGIGAAFAGGLVTLLTGTIIGLFYVGRWQREVFDETQFYRNTIRPGGRYY